MDLYLGLDLGTSAIKALLVDPEGRVRGVGSAEYPVHHPQPGYAEQDPNDWWAATVAAVRQAIGWAPAGSRVAGIGVAGQMHGAVLLGDDDLPVAPAIIWADGRSWRQVAEITERIGAAKLIDTAGRAVAAGFQAATIAWLQKERSSLWWRTRRVLSPKDELRRRLTGEIATDPGEASGTLLLDVRWRTWSPDLLKAVGVEEAKLPPLRPAVAPAGGLSVGSAVELGLPAGAPVVVGTGDAPAGLLGAGIVDPDTMLLSISTGAQVMVPATFVIPDPAGRSHTFCAALEPGTDRPGWYQMGATLVAGMALRWLRDEMLGQAGPDAYERMTTWAGEAPAGSRGLLFLPFMVGERSPHMDSRLRAAFLGLGAHHGRNEVVRAVMEGTVLACFDAFEVLREGGATPSRIVMAGGGARSPVWRQIVADVFGLPVHALATADQAAFGAAILAAAGIGGLDPVATARAWSSTGPPLPPTDRGSARYAELVPLYREATEATRSISHKLVDFAEPARGPIVPMRPSRRG
ncbi:MAG: Xylulose kinase [uncultured Thermomicrobiales bacterium]|uniref:Xylulose kinase n=1 Tax=uncultured Thermomicrobiales bacterium TaxID=1645740 RepID=A0A6J4VMY6_9BACT|nr:MAG: Xylulose kinase [uncultured Thermomicrobiales bacterium]